MHSLPEANYLNPAVQNECGVFIGLPLVSSIHMNIANSGFTADQAIILYTDESILRKSTIQVPSFPGKKYFLSEFHSVLLAAGLKRKEYYYSFTITEKNNLMLGYTPDLVHFVYDGSEQFRNDFIELEGATAAFNHVREYALGVSKEYSEQLTIGIKAKLLFGKFNYDVTKSSLGLYVEDNLDLRFDMDAAYSSSMPWALEQLPSGTYRFNEVYEDSWFNRMMNRRNPGLAMDIGFIYQYDDRWTFSGSLIDLGFIWYRSNLSNYSLNGNQIYSGPFGQGQVTDAGLWDVFDEWNLNMEESLTYDESYLFFIDPRMYLGASRKLNDRYDLNFLLYNHLLPGKLQTGFTVSLLTSPDKVFQPTVSWSVMNGSFLNLGAGFRYGNRPVQVYAVTDNLVGFILPFNVKNINLRFGLNLFLRCREGDMSLKDPGCSWMSEKRIRRARAKRGY